MDEFLKLNWRTQNISDLEPQTAFVTEESISNSLLYKSLHDKELFKARKKKKKPVFRDKIYVPGESFKNQTVIKSSLDEWSHEQCLKAFKLLHSGRDSASFTAKEQYLIGIFNKLQPKIIEEHSKFESYVLNEWNKYDKLKFTNIKSQKLLYGKKIWEEKWNRAKVYPRYYKELSAFHMTCSEDENIIDFKHTYNALELGTVARFSYPELKSSCRLICNTLPSIEEKPSVHSKLPVSQDENITDLLQEFDIDLIISSSGLKCITDNADLKNKWMIPVIVKKIIKKENGTEVAKNVVFLDKPFSYFTISKLDLVNITYKRLIKTNFCQFEAFNFPAEDKVVKTENTETAELPSENEKNKCSQYKIHHNAAYRIWNVKKTDCQNNLMKHRSKPVEFNVLIRSKLKSCERNESGNLQPVVLKPKQELQLKHGANVASKSELAREWTSLFFTPFSNLYRVRLAPSTDEVVCVEKCTIQKVVAEAQTHYQYKPHLSLSVLQKVFEELIQLQPGNYLLQHLPKHEQFLAILKETAESNGDSFDFHEECNKITVDHYPNNWLPIDVKFVLPHFEAINRMPGMFSPRRKFQENRKKKVSKGVKGS